MGRRDFGRHDVGSGIHFGSRRFWNLGSHHWIFRRFWNLGSQRRFWDLGLCTFGNHHRNFRSIWIFGKHPPKQLQQFRVFCKPTRGTTKQLTQSQFMVFRNTGCHSSTTLVKVFHCHRVLHMFCICACICACLCQETVFFNEVLDDSLCIQMLLLVSPLLSTGDFHNVLPEIR